VPSELLAAASDDTVRIAVIDSAVSIAAKQFGALQVGVPFRNVRINQAELFAQPLISCGMLLHRYLHIATHRIYAIRELLLRSGEVLTC
jgi:hypothetical protein